MLTVNFQSRVPVYQQLYDDVIRMAAVGVLQKDAKLPPVRTLATELGINPNTVQKAYKMLENDGYIYSLPGSGSFLAENISLEKTERLKIMQELEYSLSNAYKKGITKQEIYSMVDRLGGKTNDRD